MKTLCKHIKCRKCGGIKARKIGAVLSDVCHPKCQGAADDVCECKCKGRYHKGSNAKELNKILNKGKKISGMTPAQKKNVERFKAAAAEAKKIRAKDPKLSQAEAVKKAFAKLYGVSSSAKKKAPAKASGSSHKDTKSQNVNIRVMSGTKKRVGALPVGFTGKFLGWPFKVLNQFTLDGGVTAQIVELDPPGKIIAELDGRKEDVERAFQKIFNKILKPYSELSETATPGTWNKKSVPVAIKKFLTQLNSEVSKYNSGKDRKTKTAKPVVIKYTAKVKKLAVVDQIKSILAANTQRLKNGYTLVKGKPRIKENAIGAIKRDAVQSLKKMTDTLSAVMQEKAATKTRAAGMSAGAKKVTAAHLRDLATNERALKKRIAELKRVI
jgi:hypothetical protein